MRGLGLLAALVAVAWVPPAAGGRQVFHWTDAEGVSHFADRPPPGGAPVVEPDDSRVSVVETVVVTDNAMREVISREVQRQTAHRRAQVEAAARADAAATRARTARCESLRGKVRQAERKTGSLLSGELRRLDDAAWDACH